MATFSWLNSTQAFNWTTSWDIGGLGDDVPLIPPVPPTATQFTVGVPGDDTHVYNGTGFAGYSDGFPSSGTVTRVRTYGDGVLTADLSGLSMSVPTFQGYVVAGDTNGFLNAVFGGADTINGNAKGDLLHGLGGNDTLNGNGGADKLFGDAGNDKLNGAAGADTLSGAIGVDTLNGGAGHDALAGGAGADRFVFNVAAAAANTDTIADFSHAQQDKIQFDNATFTALGANAASLASAKFWASASGNAHDADDRILYNSVTGQLYYDSDGTGSHAKLLIATLTGHPALMAADIAVI